MTAAQELKALDAELNKIMESARAKKVLYGVSVKQGKFQASRSEGNKTYPVGPFRPTYAQAQNDIPENERPNLLRTLDIFARRRELLKVVK